MDNLSDNQIAARIRLHFNKGLNFRAAVRACGWLSDAEYQKAQRAVKAAGCAREFRIGKRRDASKPSGWAMP